MRLRIPLALEWSTTASPAGTVVHAGSDVTLTIGVAQPLPYNARQWGDRMVFGTLPPTRVAVREVDDRVTEEGWPVTVVVSDELADDGAVVERRLHGLFRVAQHGFVVGARSARPAAIDEGKADLTERLMRSAVDFNDQLTSLDQVWSGLELRDATAGPILVGAVPEPKD